MKTAQIIPLLPIDKSFTYENTISAQVGDLVTISFRNKKEVGICLSVEEVETQEIKYKILPIESIVLPQIIKPELMRFLLFFGQYNCIEIGTVMQMSIPDNFIKNNQIEHIKLFSFNPDFDNGKTIQIKSLYKKIYKQLNQMQPEMVKGLSIDEFTERLKCRTDTVIGLIDLGILQEDIQTNNMESRQYGQMKGVANLNEEQQKAVDVVKYDTYFPLLLYGTTGSGKTEVFISMFSRVLKNDPKAQILLLLPEVAMVSGVIKNIENKLNIKPIIWHSIVGNKAKRQNIFSLLRDGPQIVIGARSALLLPYKNLKFIVVDEEHDRSYKQNEAPVYHARNMAVSRAQIEKIPIVLSTATPSVESYHNALLNKYNMIKLTKRFNNVSMPKIILSDERLIKGRHFCQTSLELMRQATEKNKQILIFLNRRGYCRMLQCKNCDHICECINCDNKLTFHKAKNLLKCHYCGFEVPISHQCTKCNSEVEFIYSGHSGVEKVADEIRELLGENRQIQIFSSDSLTNSHKTQSILEDIVSNKINIIIGTQIVTKGYNFPHLALVIALGVVNNGVTGDFRVFENTYQMLTQVAGRAGRMTGDGTVVIQTQDKHHPSLQAMLSDIEDHFYKEELNRRQSSNLPPFSHQAAIVISGESEEDAHKTADAIHKKIQLHSASFPGVRALGPITSFMHYSKRQYHYQFLLQHNQGTKLRSFAQLVATNHKTPRDVRIKIDIDPYDLS